MCSGCRMPISAKEKKSKKYKEGSFLYHIVMIN